MENKKKGLEKTYRRTTEREKKTLTSFKQSTNKLNGYIKGDCTYKITRG